jgi:ribonucleoside-diphosphate reductase alpha chain
MQVRKRDNSLQPVAFEKVLRRICKLADQKPKLDVDSTLIAQKVISGIFDGVTTSQLDELGSEIAIAMTSVHLHYAELAARIAVSNLHKNTIGKFSEVAMALASYVNPETQKPAPMMAANVLEFIISNADALNNAIDYNLDFNYDLHGFRALSKSYLLKLYGKIVERPQDMLMRVVCGIHCGDLDATLESYNLMSNKFFTHASPTLFNSGTCFPQCSSCFLLSMKDDSIEGIFATATDIARISKRSGGIGVAVHNIRAAGSYIASTNGTSDGIIPMLQVLNQIGKYVNQSGKRKGAIAAYLETWHLDMLAFLELRKNTGSEDFRARDLFLALWIDDLFMERVENDGEWCFFCPNSAPGLSDCYGDEFKALYESYESKPNLVRKRVKARVVWQAILSAQEETGLRCG